MDGTNPATQQFHAESHPLEMRLHEAHHRIANDLAIIAGMVRLQAQAVRDDHPPGPADVRASLVDAASRIDAVGRLHRTLCYAMDGRATKDFLQGVCRDAASFAGVGGSKVSCRVDVAHEPGPERLRALGLLVHEMVLNGLKHAHPTGVAGHIDVWVRDEPGGILAVDVADDGVGFPDDFDPYTSSGFGFRMMRELAKQLDALLAFESTPLGLICQLRTRRSD